MYNVYCTCKVIYTNRSGIFPKMLPSIYVGESFIRDIYPDSHQKKFTTGFYSTVVSNQRKSNETTGPASLLGTPSASTFGRKLEFETSKVGSNDGSGHVYVWRDEGILVILQICVDDLVFVL